MSRNSTTRLHRLVAATAATAAFAAPAQALVYVWSDGNYTALPRPATIDASSTLLGTTGTDKGLNIHLANDGTIAWQTTDPLFFLGGGTTLRNNSLYDQQLDGRINATNGGQVFDNAGTLRKSGGTGELVVGVQVTNRAGGRLVADSGSINYRGSGLFEAASVFAGSGAHVFDGRASLYTFQGSFIGNGNLRFVAGRFLAAAEVRPQSDFVFSAGTFEGPWVVERAATMTAISSGGDGKFIQGGFTNDGTIAWQTSEPLVYFAGGTTLRNNGVFDQQVDGSIDRTNGAQTFDNAGTLRKSGGTGELVVGVQLTNRAGGRLVADSGSINYRGSSLFEAGSVFAGGGAHVFDGRASLYTFQGSFIGNGKLRFLGGRYLASAEVRPQSDFVFSAGLFEGPWVVERAATMTAIPSGGDGKFIQGRFTNDGTIAWLTNEPLVFFAGGTTLRNNGLFDQQGNGSIDRTNGGQLFDNAGTLRKSAGTGAFVVSVPLLNTGVIESLAGTIVLPDNWTNNGTLRGTAAYRSNRIGNAGLITPGNTAEPELARLTIDGSLVQTDLGRLRFEVGAGAASDRLDVSGSASFAGVLEVVNSVGYLPALGDSFRVMNFASYSGTFSGVAALGFGDGVVFEAVYAPDHLDVRVSAVPEPAAAWMLGLGLAWLWRRRGLAPRRA